MCNEISSVRSYVGLQVRKPGACRRGVREKAGNSEKRPWQAGMSKGMKRLAGYVAAGGGDNWDL